MRIAWSLVRGIAPLTLAFAANVFAQAPAAPGGAAAAPPPDQLEAIVGRIALYPDDLVAIILPASTNPLQIVQADRYLDKRKADPKLPVDPKLDDAVKSLLNYPDVVKSMSNDLDWTTALGEAVVADQGEVLAAIQAFRRKAQAAGNLKTDPKQVVVVEKEVVKIVPADPQVIYVPQYNPTTVVVYGSPAPYGYYPTPYPSYYYPYPPGAALATGVVWGAAMGAAWSGNHYGANYSGNANININNSTTINTANVNKTNVNTANVNRSNASTQAAAGSTQWKSDKQPGQVSGSVGKTASTQVGAAQARPSTASAGGSAAATRSSAPAAGSGSALSGGTASGRQTQMDSSRGAASRSSMSGGGAAASAGGGGAHGAGGGGGGGRRR